ncbi:leucine-rich repeat domain-containing protein [Rickettsia rickettsii]|uniref:hypothetical protein n=1 Tax=Rickettsia rickettsii TaxID=783 RepID=UPI00059E17C9|nr:hypothetical protein [Rickettsia rickettsii]
MKKDESPKRQKIDLSRNDLLLQKIKNNDPEIVRVELPYEEDSSFLSIVIKTLEKNTVVKEIDLYGSNLSNDDIKNLSKIVKLNQISHLNLNSTSLDSEKIKILIYALADNTSLEYLSLNSIALKIEYLRILIDAIKNHPNLSSLALGSSEVGNKGAAIISELFHSKLPLKSLDIGQMNITAEGIDVIANNISSAKLMSLNLGYNNLRNEGVIKLLHALMANQYIKELILNETRISEKSAEVIENFLTSHLLIL